MARQRKQRAKGAEIEQVRRRIEHWRRTRTKKTRMPEKLWAEAVRLAREHGLYAASQGLGVNYEYLKMRLKGRMSPKKRPSSRPAATFVEVGTALPFAGGSAGATLELTEGNGAKLAIRLAAGDRLDLVGLVREFWSRRP
jgi:hypothetical protein